MFLFLSALFSFALFSFAPSWFMQGMLHPLQTPSHILLVLSLGLLIGQQLSQKRFLLSSVILFSFSVLVGLILNRIIRLDFDIELILLGLGLLISLLVIIKLPLPSLLIAFLVIISGIGLGLNSSPIVIPGLGSTSVYNWQIGAACSFIAGVLPAALIACFINNYWQGIILRVLASWIATSAIFVLAFILIQP